MEMMRGKREKKKKGNSTLWAALLVALFVAVSFNISILHLSEWGGDSSTSRWWPGNRMRAAKVDTAQASLTESSPHVVVIAPSPENNASSSSHEDAVWAEPPNAGMESTGHAMGKAEDLSKQTAKAEEGEGEGGDDDDGERQGPDSGIQTREKVPHRSSRACLLFASPILRGLTTGNADRAHRPSLMAARWQTPSR